MSSTNSLIYSYLKIEEITQGKWVNLTNELIINDFIHLLKQVKKNDIFIVHYKSWYNKKQNNEDEISEAIKKGASSLIVEKQTDISNINIPVLIVENSFEAMKRLALYAAKNTNAKKVLITGSNGKTGFKNHLYTISNQRVYTRLHSSNRFGTTLGTLASIKQDTQLFLIEVPIRRKNRTQVSSKYINPDICVITSIGHEHIEKHGSVEEIIKEKCSVAQGLKNGGKIIIPGDSVYTPQIKKELQKYKDITILTFGNSENCNAQILNKYFIDNKWVITARVEYELIQYEVFFIDEHAPLSSLAELLCLKHLGEDIYKCANKYIQCKNYKSSGNLYKLNFKGKEILLYDQSARGGVEGYKSFFKTIKRLSFKKNSRKIVVSSEFIDLKDGEEQFIDDQLFTKLIFNANIDIFYGFENFDIHKNLISSKTFYKGVSKDITELEKTFYESIEDGDIICIKGIFESKITSFVNSFIKSSQLLPRFLKRDFNSKDLKGCEVLSLKHNDLYKKYIKNEKHPLWCKYFPFLYFFSKSSSRKIVIKRTNDSLSIFLLRNLNMGSKVAIQLYFFPIPFNINDFRIDLKLIKNFNKTRRTTILWCDEQNLLEVGKYKEFSSNMEFVAKNEEFIFDSILYEHLQGSKFKNLRRKINMVKRIENLKVEPYRNEFLNEALELYDTWKVFQKTKYDSITDENYTKNALLNFEKFSKYDIKGIVIRIDNQLKAFALYGKINGNIYNLFVAKSDLSIKGLQLFLKYQVFLDCEGLLVNSSDAITTGLYNSKMELKPVIMQKVYKARYNFI